MNSGRILKALRLLKGLTQAEVAAKLKISQQAYSKIEKQESVTHKKISRILSILNVSKEYLAAIRNISLTE